MEKTPHFNQQDVQLYCIGLFHAEICASQELFVACWLPVLALYSSPAKVKQMAVTGVELKDE